MTISLLINLYLDSLVMDYYDIIAITINDKTDPLLHIFLLYCKISFIGGCGGGGGGGSVGDAWGGRGLLGGGGNKYP